MASGPGKGFHGKLPATYLEARAFQTLGTATILFCFVCNHLSWGCFRASLKEFNEKALQISTYAGEEIEVVTLAVDGKNREMAVTHQQYMQSTRPQPLCFGVGTSNVPIAAPADAFGSLADVSDAQRFLDQSGLSDLTVKGIKKAQHFPDLQKKLKIIALCIRNYKAEATEQSFQNALASFDTLSPETAPGAWLEQLLNLKVGNTVKVCSSETSEAPAVLVEIKSLYTFMEKEKMGLVKEVEDRVLVALLNRTKFRGWREVLVSTAALGLFKHHLDLQDAVLLFENASGNPSLQDLEQAVKQALSMEASKALSRLIKTGLRAQQIFEKMHALGATQKLQPALRDTYALLGQGFTEMMKAIYEATDTLRMLVDADAKSTEFVELQTACETVCATLVTKINADLYNIWDGVLVETMDVDTAWKRWQQVQILCGSMSMVSREQLEKLNEACDDVWLALSVHGEWKLLSAAKQLPEASKFATFMKSVKKGIVSVIGRGSDRSKKFFADLSKFANEKLATFESGKRQSLEALLGTVCGGQLDGNILKEWFQTFFSGLMILDVAQQKENLGTFIAPEKFTKSLGDLATFFDFYDCSPLAAFIYSTVLYTFAKLPAVPFPNKPNNEFVVGDAENVEQWMLAVGRLQTVARRSHEIHASPQNVLSPWEPFEESAAESVAMIKSVEAAAAETLSVIGVRLKAALQDVLTRSDKLLADDMVMFISHAPESCKEMFAKVDSLANDGAVASGPQNPKGRGKSRPRGRGRGRGVQVAPKGRAKGKAAPSQKRTRQAPGQAKS